MESIKRRIEWADRQRKRKPREKDRNVTFLRFGWPIPKELDGEFARTIFSRLARIERHQRRNAGQSFTLNLSLRRYLYLHSLLAYIYLETLARKKIYRPSGRVVLARSFQPLSFENISIRRFVKRVKKGIKSRETEGWGGRGKKIYTDGENCTSEWRAGSVSQALSCRKERKGLGESWRGINHHYRVPYLARRHN